jgi:hypothetical protein
MAVDRPTITFSSLNVPRPITNALAAAGIVTPTPIQARTLPDSLAGRDVLGRGRTGSGKTYAFLVPLVTRLAATVRPPAPGRPRALVLVPTRELAVQVEAALAAIAGGFRLRWTTVFGGVSERPQIAALRTGTDIVIACPGRLASLVEDGHARLDAIEITVLDEADHMADLGFLPVVRRLLSATPRTGQRLLFSATLDHDIDGLVREFLRRPVTHEVDTDATPVRMTHHALQVQQDHLLPVLADLTGTQDRTLVFTRTKHAARRVTRQLRAVGVDAVELHGNLAQQARTRNLQEFADGGARTLVATDIAARGIHVDDVTLGIVVTLFTPDRQAEVTDLARRAGIRPTVRAVRPGDPLLSDLAPGPRVSAPPARVEPIGAGSEGQSDRRTGSRRAGGREQVAGRAGRRDQAAGGAGEAVGVGGRGQAAGRGGKSAGGVPGGRASSAGRRTGSAGSGDVRGGSAQPAGSRIGSGAGSSRGRAQAADHRDEVRDGRARSSGRRGGGAPIANRSDQAPMPAASPGDSVRAGGRRRRPAKVGDHGTGSAVTSARSAAAGSARGGGSATGVEAFSRRSRLGR